MKPWNISFAHDDKERLDAFTIPLWQEFNHKDFYFAIQYQYESTLVFIVPKEYYDDKAVMFDDSMPIVQLLPESLIEIYSGVYETKKSLNDIKRELSEMGFIYDHFFQEFINNNWHTV